MSTNHFHSARSPLRAVQWCGRSTRRRAAGAGNSSRRLDHPGSGRDRLAHSAAESDERQPGDGRRLRPDQDRRRDARRRPDQQPAAGVRRLRRQPVERRDRRGDRESAQPRLAAHAGAGQQPPPDARRSDAERRGLARSQPDSGGADRARRSADGRRICRVRRRRRRRRRQLHHERQVRRRAGRCPVQHVPAQQRRRRRSRSIVRDSGLRRCPTSNVRDGYTQGHHVHRRHQHPDGRGNATVYFGYRSSIRSRRTGATSARARSAPPTRRSDSNVQLRRLRHHGAGAVPDLQPERSERPQRHRRTSPSATTARCATSRHPTCSTSRRRTTTSAPTSARRPACSRTTTSATRPASTPSSCSWTIARRRRSHRAVRSSAPARAQPPFFGRYAVNCDNPLLSPSAVNTFCGGDCRRGRRAARHRPAQRRRRRPQRRSAAHLVPRRRRPARRHRRRLELRRVRPVRHFAAVRELSERLLALAHPQVADSPWPARTASPCAASTRTPT